MYSKIVKIETWRQVMDMMCSEIHSGRNRNDLYELANGLDKTIVPGGRIATRALHVAAVLGRDDICLSLLHHGTKPDGLDGWGYTPLHVAVGHNKIKILRQLLSYGADPDMKNAYGWAALHFLLGDDSNSLPRSSRSRMVKMLLDAGADANLLGAGGNMPLHRISPHTPLDSVLLLLQHGADPNMPNQQLATPLLRAAEAERDDVIAALLAYGANPRAAGANRVTALHLVAQHGSPTGHTSASITALLRHGANVNAKMDSGQTPLHLAAAAGDGLAISLLLQAGADHSIRDKFGRNAADYAKLQGHNEVAAQIQRATHKKPTPPKP